MHCRMHSALLTQLYDVQTTHTTRSPKKNISDEKQNRTDKTRQKRIGAPRAYRIRTPKTKPHRQTSQNRIGAWRACRRRVFNLVTPCKACNVRRNTGPHHRTEVRLGRPRNAEKHSRNGRPPRIRPIKTRIEAENAKIGPTTCNLAHQLTRRQ